MSEACQPLTPPPSSFGPVGNKPLPRVNREDVKHLPPLERVLLEHFDAKFPGKYFTVVGGGP